MPITTELTRRLGISHPIIQAPMAGGATTAELIAAVCEAGGLGCIAAAYTSPQLIAGTAAAVRERTDRPFGINLFAPVAPPDMPTDAAPAVGLVRRFHDELGLPPPDLPPPVPDPFEALFPAVLESGAAVLSFTFGILPVEALRAARSRHMLVMGTATTVDEAIALRDAGVDAVIAQGAEAGAHRGTFLRDFSDSLVGTLALVPQVSDAVDIPVIASGGIMEGRGIAAALALGAAAVQMGTAFLTCDEAGVSDAHKRAILGARESDTRITRVFSGRPARGIVNRFMETVERDGGPAAILPFPMQTFLTQPLRAAAARMQRPELLSLWAGQGVRMARRQSAAALMGRLVAETESAVQRLAESMESGR